eukprot:1167826-Pleurochrysis_carterae.AAC.2
MHTISGGECPADNALSRFRQGVELGDGALCMLAEKVVVTAVSHDAEACQERLELPCVEGVERVGP